MRSYFSIYAPTVVSILLSVAFICEFRVTKVDVNSAFLQTGAAECSVYVVPPREFQDRFMSLWLLLAASYGLVNAKEKFQVQSEALLLKLGLLRLVDIPQLFYAKADGKLTILLAKIVDEILIIVHHDLVEYIIPRFDRKFKIGTVVHDHGPIRYFVLHILQSDNFIV